MYQWTEKELDTVGARITAREINQQPALWKEAFANYRQQKNKIDDFLATITKKHPHLQILFCGAGTSAFVGQLCAPYLRQKLDDDKFTLLEAPTTAVVSNPELFFKKNRPTLMVSFARSGNSPESLAAVALGAQLVDDFYQLTITCAADGKLAQMAKGDKNNLVLLMPPASNDQGFAMTGSFTCMLLTSLLVFDSATDEEKEKYAGQMADAGTFVLQNEESIAAWLNQDVERVVYLGSGVFEALAREAQLKILELTAGKIATCYESCLGFRHGPKSFVDDKTLIFAFVSANPYTRFYDEDILGELLANDISPCVCGITASPLREFKGKTFELPGVAASLPDPYLAIPYLLVAQTIALHASVKVGNTPDTPSASGTVNRVVKGVTIYPYQS